VFTEGYDPGNTDRNHQQAFFYHKYTPSGAVGSSWHSWMSKEGVPILPIQEDETGLIIWSLWKHYEQYRDIEFARKMYEDMIVPAANFMCHYRDPILGLPNPSYDLWEERLGIHTFTVGSIYGGLQAAANFATVFGDVAFANRYREVALELKNLTINYLWSEDKQRFYRCINFNPITSELKVDDTLDISGPFALFFFEMFSPDDAKIAATMQQVQDKLWVKTEVGGIARYENETYHQISQDVQQVPGNPWIVCTMWLAQWHILKAQNLIDLESAMRLLEWVGKLSLSSGLLAEQFNPYTGEAISVCPLTWSHASFASTVVLYLDKFKKIGKRERLKKMAGPVQYQNYGKSYPANLSSGSDLD
jgi:GH15 family glucan-1,4-alpha-glucosidase